jgi:hypothetical protein
VPHGYPLARRIGLSSIDKGMVETGC